MPTARFPAAISTSTSTPETRSIRRSRSARAALRSSSGRMTRDRRHPILHRLERRRRRCRADHSRRRRRARRPGRRDARRRPLAGGRRTVQRERRHRLPVHRCGRSARSASRTSSTTAPATKSRPTVAAFGNNALVVYEDDRGTGTSTSRRASSTGPASRPRSRSPTPATSGRPGCGGADRRPLHRRLGRR